jgi:glycerophosphoryl diester phosphodiesterase
MARHPRLLEVPIGFAHRGASALAPGNTLEAFRLAVEMGASGLESDVWVSDDGEPVLDHDGIVGGWLRRRPIATVPRARLPEHITTLRELYAEVGSHLPLSLDIKDPDAIGPVLDVADEVGARERLWLCHPDPEVLVPWRERSAGARLVVSTKFRTFRQGAERAGAELSGAGIDAVNLHHTEWTGGLTTLFHRFGLYTFGWDVQLPRHLAELLDMGVDGVFSDHVDRMMEAIAVETMGLSG